MGDVDGGDQGGAEPDWQRRDDGTFAAWWRLRESQGPRVSLIRLYAMAAEARGLRADDPPGRAQAGDKKPLA